jgi:auxin efflux carrier family protein
MAPTGLLESFLGAIQASLSVLLVIFYGGVAARLNLLSPASTKAISKISVRMFLPALLIVQIGQELHAGSAGRYGIILAWALICHLVSFIIGIVAHLVFGMPDWTTVALMFNNTTSYPLLLIQALNDTGILKSLIVDDETTREAIERAKSYFLVFATISSCLTFAVGPRLIDSEHAPEPEEEEHKDGEANGHDEHSNGQDNNENGASQHDGAHEESSLLPQQRRSTITFADPFHEGRNSFLFSRRKASLAPQPHADGTDEPITERVASTTKQLARRASVVPRKTWLRLGPRTKWWLLFISDFFNAPLLGAIIGAVIGLTPALHRAFFADSADGGIFTAWLTASLKSIGSLFVPLPVVVAGVSLYTAFQEARQNKGAGASTRLPVGTTAFILVIRFIIWPIASILTIWGLAVRTQVLGEDPMLWFAMMLMPTGPPAMKLITLVQVSDAEEEDERNIAKLLTVSILCNGLRDAIRRC